MTTQSRLDLEAGDLRAVVDAARPQVVLLRGDRPLLPALAPSLPPAFATVFAEGRSAVATGHVKRDAGPAHRAEWLAWQDDGRWARWCLELDAAGRGLSATLALGNRSDAPLALGSLVPLAAAAPIPGATRRVLFAQGAEEREALTLAPSPAGGALLLGFTTARTGFGRFTSDASGTRANCQAPAWLEPGQEIQSDRAFIGLAESEDAALIAFAERAGHDMASGQPRRASASGGWAERLCPDAVTPYTEYEGPASDAPTLREALRDARAERSAGGVLAASGPLVACAGDADAYRPAGGLFEVAWTAQRLVSLDAVLEEPANPPGPSDQTALALAGLVAGHVRTPRPGPEATGAWLQCALPPLGRRASRPAANIMVVALVGERIAVLIHNPTSTPQPLGLEFARVGRAGAPHHVYDFFANAYLGLTDEGVASREVGAGGCRLLALTPQAERPQVVGSSLHVGMGTAEVAALRERDGGLVLAMRHAGQHAGNVFVSPGSRAPVQDVAVRFDGRGEFVVPGP